MAPTLSATLSTGLVLDVKSATITLDEASSPYVSATLTCAAPAGDLLETIDPRKGQRVVLVLNDRADLFDPTVPAISRRLDLSLHSREHGVNAGELVLQLYSDEETLLDRVLLLRNVKAWGATTAIGLVQKVLASLGFALAPTSAIDYTIADGADVQSPGQSYWDFLDGTLQGGNLRLWCDELRVWHIADKGAIAAGLCSLDYRGTVTGLNDAIGLDENYFDALVVMYSYLDRSGNAQTSYDYAGDASAKRGTRVQFTSPPAVDGAARRLLRRVQGRGRVLSHEAVARYDVTPTQSFIATLPDGSPVQTGLVSAVTWDIPSDRMTVRSRELSDTDPTQWAAQPLGATWASVPAGVAWSAMGGKPWANLPAGASWDSVPAGMRWSEMGTN